MFRMGIIYIWGRARAHARTRAGAYGGACTSGCAHRFARLCVRACVGASVCRCTSEPAWVCVLVSVPLCVPHSHVPLCVRRRGRTNPAHTHTQAKPNTPQQAVLALTLSSCCFRRLVRTERHGDEDVECLSGGNSPNSSLPNPPLSPC